MDAGVDLRSQVLYNVGMKNFQLTVEEVQELRAAHKSAKNKADAYRINAVILLGTGWTLEEVVDALLLDDEMLRNYASNYKMGGLEQLLERNYKGERPKLPIEYLKFMENKKENEAVFFVDAVHPTWNSMAAYGWIKKGTIRELASNSGRARLNIHGAMNAETFETTVIASESNVDTDSTISLFQALERFYPFAAIIYIILDNAKYHFSGPILEYVKHSRIQLIFLPSYSPGLNLIERLWRVFKKNILYNKHYETYKEFKKSCMGFFERQSDYLQEIETIMGIGLEALA